MGVILERLVTDYAETPSAFPDDGLKKSLKNDPKFFLRLSKAMLYQYFNNWCCIPWNWGKNRSIDELRSYAMGEQDINKYKPYLCQALKEQDGKAFMNISWEAVRSIPKFRNVIKGIAIKTMFDIQVNALDPSSVAERNAEEAYWKLQTDPEWVAFSKEMKKLGARVQKPQFKSEEQVNVWIKSGGLKLAVEIALKTALEATQYLSRFEDSVKIELIDDLIDIGMCATRDYVESGTKYVKARYVDPNLYIGRFSQYLDNHNSDYGGELRLMTISELRQESNLSEAELFWIARKYQTDFGNSMGRFVGNGIFNTTFSSRYKDVYGCSPIDDMKVPVLDAVYVSADTNNYLKTQKREWSNNYVFKEVNEDYALTEVDKRQKSQVEGRKNEVIYKFKHILGTDFVFDYGLDEDIAHDGVDGHKKAVNPYHVYKTGTASIVDLMIPYEDDMCLSTYKWRNAKARMIPPPGMVVEKGVMENITLGGVKMSPKQAFAMGIETGYLVIQSLGDHGRSSLSANSAPLTPIPNTAIEHFNIFMADMNYNMAQIKELTGINDITAGNTPEERQGLGVTKIAIQSSNNTLYPLFKGYEVVFEQTMTSCAKRWQNVLRNGDVKGYYKAIGQNNLQVFKLSKDISLIEFGLTIQALPSEQEIEALLAEITALKNQNVTTGAGGISPENYLLIYETIKSKNIKLAQLQLAWSIQEQREAEQQAAMQREQMNGQIQQQAVIANTQSKQALEEQSHGYKKEEMMLQDQIDTKARAEDHRNTMEEIAAKGSFAIEQKNIGAQESLTKELIKQKKEKKQD